MKDETAERLAHAHYRIDPTLRLVRRLIGSAAEEADPEEPVKLLEVNEATIAAGIVPIYFQAHPSSGIIYPSLIVEIAPEEYDQILAGTSVLPHNWELGEVIEREAATH